MSSHADSNGSGIIAITRLSRWTLLVVPFFVATSCISSKLEKNLAANAETQADVLTNLSNQIANESVSLITWKDAHKRMEENNLSLRTSKQQLKDAKNQTKDQWLTLVPNLSSYLSVGDSVSELSDLDQSNLNVNVIANLNIPNPFEFHASLYAAALEKQNAIWSHELDKRRAYVQLYSAFLDENVITEQEAALEAGKRRMLSVSGDEAVKAFKRFESDEASLQRRRSHQRISMNQLLNTPGSNWKPVGGLPNISYRSSFNRISVGEHFGKLALNLQTIQIEGALLRVQQVKFQQWPIVNFSLSTPALYTSQGNTPSFSSDELQFFSGASKGFNVTDIGGRESVQDAEIRLKFTREQLRSRMESEIVRIQEGKATYKRLLTEEKYILNKISKLENQGDSDPVLVNKDLETLIEMQLKLGETRRRLQQLDLQFLIWDENHWKN